MIRPIIKTISLLMIPVIMGCTAHRPPVALIETLGQAPHYSDILEQVTRNSKDYFAVQTQVEAYIIYESLDYKLARIRQLAERQGLSQIDQESWVAEAEKDMLLYVDFIVFLYTFRLEDNDMNHKNSIWSVTLSTPAGITRPSVSIVQMEKKNPSLAYLYPMSDRWNTPYRVRFERTVDGHDLFDPRPAALQLDIRGLAGKLSARWTSDAVAFPIVSKIVSPLTAE